MSRRAEAAERLRLLLAIVPWLLTEGGAPLSEVAHRSGLPVAEVVEMLELAACCGLPPYSPDRLLELIVEDDRVEAFPGSHLTRPVRLSAEEGLAVAASGRAILAVPGADPSGSLARAVEKLEAVLGSRVEVELDEPDHLPEVRDAALAGERVELDYYSASRDELTTRRVDPIRLFSEEGHWYLEAHCHLSDDLRHFRVDRIRDVRRTGEPADVSPSYGTGATDGPVFIPGPGSQVVRLRLHPEGRWVVESVPTLHVEEDGDGRLEVTLAVGGRAWLERLLLRLGPGAELLDPPDLVDTRREAARRVLSRYA
jgi:predicted DNA-binding transcriptional regulator YafY